MKTRTAILALALCTMLAAAAAAADSTDHRTIRPADLEWSPVGSLPAGAEIAVIEGPMSAPTSFTVRLKFPANYEIPPHFHPAVERVTVISGVFHLGVGEAFCRLSAERLETGTISILQPGTPHYAWTEGEVIVQLNGVGPWGITYIDPEDDPRNK